MWLGRKNEVVQIPDIIQAITDAPLKKYEALYFTKIACAWRSPFCDSGGGLPHTQSQVPAVCLSQGGPILQAPKRAGPASGCLGFLIHPGVVITKKKKTLLMLKKRHRD